MFLLNITTTSLFQNHHKQTGQSKPTIEQSVREVSGRVESFLYVLFDIII